MPGLRSQRRRLPHARRHGSSASPSLRAPAALRSLDPHRVLLLFSNRLSRARLAAFEPLQLVASSCMQLRNPLLFLQRGRKTTGLCRNKGRNSCERFANAIARARARLVAVSLLAIAAATGQDCLQGSAGHGDGGSRGGRADQICEERLRTANRDHSGHRDRVARSVAGPRRARVHRRNRPNTIWWRSIPAPAIRSGLASENRRTFARSCPPALIDNILPKLREAATYNDKLVAVPQYWNTEMYFYRKDLFARPEEPGGLQGEVWLRPRPAHDLGPARRHR